MHTNPRLRVLLAVAIAALTRLASADVFTIQVVDESTNRAVPLVELSTVSSLRFYTDSAGVVAITDPVLMNHKVFFTVKSHGYEFPKDGFGFAGVALEVAPGKSATLKIKRLNIAERLYRTTGEGIYAESLLAGRKPPIAKPVLNGGVVGSDSVQAAVYRGQIYWFWGDTNRLAYPLGNFATTGATSKLPADGGLDPAVGIDLAYFEEDGFAKKMAPIDRPGPIWTDALMTVRDESGNERLVANIIRVKTLGENLERGIVVFNDEKQIFEKVVDIPLDHPLGPQGQTVTKLVRDGDVEYQLFSHWGPGNIRVPAKFDRVMDLASYEGFTALEGGFRFDIANPKDTKLQRDKDGKLVWGWKKDTPPLGTREIWQLIQVGKMTADESHATPRDVDSGQPVQLHSASVAWNDFRKRWIMIALEFDGTSKLGEVWYGESDLPQGPWKSVKKVVTHDRYSFYNPRHHAFFDGEGGRYIYFEGTFANSISGTDIPTPRYDYNNVMYRLDLADPRLKPTQAP